MKQLQRPELAAGLVWGFGGNREKGGKREGLRWPVSANVSICGAKTGEVRMVYKVAVTILAIGFGSVTKSAGVSLPTIVPS